MNDATGIPLEVVFYELVPAPIGYDYIEVGCPKHQTRYPTIPVTKKHLLMPTIKPHNYKTLSEATKALKANGYVHDFSQKEDRLACTSLSKDFNPEEFTITHAYRFEGMTNPADNSVLYTIEAMDGSKGLLVDAYGAYAEAMTPEMVEKFRVDYKTKDNL